MPNQLLIYLENTFPIFFIFFRYFSSRYINVNKSKIDSGSLQCSLISIKKNTHRGIYFNIIIGQVIKSMNANSGEKIIV